jgi:HipA-like C-terminal domain
VRGFDEHDLNEHLCLQAARLLGLSAAPSSVRSFQDERVIVVERYDRVHGRDGRVVRIHQEDACKALGEYRLEAISGRHWRRFAEANGLDPHDVGSRLRDLAQRAPEAFAAAAVTPAVREIGSELPDRLVTGVAERSRVCIRAMNR